MLKLLKYEYRKMLTVILVMLAATAALEIYFLVSLHLREEIHLAVSILGLVMCTYAAMLYVLITGVTTYSREMKDRSAYLIFMTPNSGLKIMGSKFLFAFTNAVAFAALFALLGMGDITLLLKTLDGYEEFIADINEVLRSYGLHMDQMAYAVLIVGAYAILSILSFMALTYLAVTLSHTLFRDKKWRGLAALVIFVGLNWLVGKANELLPNAMDLLVYYENPMTMSITEQYGLQTTATLNDVLLALLPQSGVSLGVILLSLFGCAWMLDKKVSL